MCAEIAELTGYDVKKILKRLVIPYIVFQTLYEIFSDLVIKRTNLSIQYTTPYWILWFLLAIFIYHLLI